MVKVEKRVASSTLKKGAVSSLPAFFARTRHTMQAK